MCPVVDTSPVAEGQKFPARLCLYLSFTTVCSKLISLMYPRVQGYNEFLHQFLLNTVCVLLLNRFQLQGFPFCFRFPIQNVQGVQVPSTSCPLCDTFLHVCFSCHQTSVFTPAYGSVTNVRVNSFLTTGQVLSLLLHKFRVSRSTHCYTWSGVPEQPETRNNIYVSL